MTRWPLAAAMVAAALVLGATVFAQPVAWAAQAVGATIVGPLDEQGNVKVSQDPVLTKLVATQVLDPRGQVHGRGQPVPASAGGGRTHRDLRHDRPHQRLR